MRYNLISAPPSEATKILLECYQQEVSVMIWGNRGIGKTSIVTQVGRQIIGEPISQDEWDQRFILEHLSQVEPSDVRGLPDLDKAAQRTVWYPPEFFPRIKGPGVVFLDEIVNAEPRIQKAAYQWILDRRIGRVRMPPGWLMVAAGNTGTDGAVIHKMDAPLADRMVHIQLHANPSEWITWAMANKIDTRIISYIKVYPHHLDGTVDQVKGNALLGPSPRGWARLSRFLDRQTPLNDTTLELIAAGILGTEVSSAFMLQYGEITAALDIDALMKIPEDADRLARLPTSLMGLYNLAYALVAVSTNVTTLEQAMRIAGLIGKIKDRMLPLAEIKTLAFELLLTKADQMKLISQVLTFPAYRTYLDERKKAGLR